MIWCFPVHCPLLPVLRERYSTQGEEAKVEAIAGFVASTVVMLVVAVGSGKFDCISECVGNGAGMHCTACDFPTDAESWISPITG